METLTYSDFSLRLHNISANSRIPIAGSIELTRRCNFRCIHCYNNLPLNDHVARDRELKTGELLRILGEIAKAGCLWLLYTGGEIFVRKDFMEIYTRSKEMGFLVTLFTNGSLITPRIADVLAERSPFCVEITFHSLRKETFERMTQIPGSYERCMNGILLLKERNIPLKLKTTVTTINVTDLWETKSFVERELRLGFRFDAMINCRVDGRHGPLAVRLSPEEIVNLDLQDRDRMNEWDKFCRRFNGSVGALAGGKLYHCGAGVNSFAINANGHLSLCMFIENGFNLDLRKTCFEHGWMELLRERSRAASRQTRCTSCEIKAMCGMCPANGILEKGDPEEPVDFLCEVAHLRAKALGLRIESHGECSHCKEKDLRT